MNTHRFLLISLILNALLVWGIMKPRPTPAPMPTAPMPQVKLVPTQNDDPALVVVPKFTWALIEDEDYYIYRENLRKLQCPEEIIRDILYADLTRVYTSQARPHLTQLHVPYWKLADGNSVERKDASEKHSRVRSQFRAVVRELLGESYEWERERRNGSQAWADQIWAFTTAEKRQAILAMETEWENHDSDQPGFAKQKRERLRAFLAPDEFEMYEMRFSNTGRRIRGDYEDLPLTEVEFQKLFRLEYPHTTKYEEIDGQEEELIRQGQFLKLAERAFAEKIFLQQKQQILSSERTEEWKRNRSQQWGQLKKTALKMKLSEPAIQSAYEVERMHQEEMKKLRQDRSMTLVERKNLETEFNESRTAALQQVLGNRGLDYYLQFSRR